MRDKRKYHLIIGSKAFLDDQLSNLLVDNAADSFLDLVKLSDAAKQKGYSFDQYAEKLVIKNDNYHGIVESAHDRLGPLIEDLTVDNAEIFIHNPPRVLKEFIEEQHRRSLIELDVFAEKYDMNQAPDMFVENIQSISSKLFGQQGAIEEISKSLWYLTSVKRKNPYVIMLYGNSGLGKTELVREISQKFFKGKCLEKHLSMFKNSNYSDYFLERHLIEEVLDLIYWSGNPI